MTAHSRLGASGAHRWMACPGSYALEAVYPNTSSPASEQGTLDHAAQERCLREGLDAKDVVDPGDSPDRAVAIQLCLDYVRDLIDGYDNPAQHPPTLLIEHRVTVEPIVPNGFGTIDVAVIMCDIAHVIDSKYGRHYVEAADNPQLAYYALGLALEYPELNHFICTILQPYTPDEPVRSVSYSRAAIMAWGERFRQGALAALAEDAPLVTGEHCGFCKALPTCPKYKDLAMLTVRTPPELMSPEQLTKAADVAELLSLWAAKVKAHLHARALAGESIPGYELMPGRQGARKYVDPVTAEAKLVAYAEATGRDLEVVHRTLASPAEIERQLGKGASVRALLDEITVREPAKLALRRVSVNEMKAAELFPSTPNEEPTNAE